MFYFISIACMEEQKKDAKKLRTKKILVAEDVEMNQYLAREILEARGAEVSIASNGYEALELLEKGFFDCILMDVQMPEMDGIETTLRIRKLTDPKKSTVPIIAVTANVLNEDIRRYKAAGMNDYLAKPFDEPALLNVISRNENKDSGPWPSPKPLQHDENLKNADTMQGTGKLYDLTMIQSVSGGDEEFIKKMIALFIETVPNNIREMSEAAGQQDWDLAGKLAHKLKSTIDSMGIKSVRDDIRKIESLCKEKKQLEEVPALVTRVDHVIVACMEQLRAGLA